MLDPWLNNRDIIGSMASTVAPVSFERTDSNRWKVDNKPAAETQCYTVHGSASRRFVASFYLPSFKSSLLKSRQSDKIIFRCSKRY